MLTPYVRPKAGRTFFLNETYLIARKYSADSSIELPAYPLDKSVFKPTGKGGSIFDSSRNKEISRTYPKANHPRRRIMLRISRFIFPAMAILALILTACQPQVLTQTVEVTKEVPVVI